MTLLHCVILPTYSLNVPHHFILVPYIYTCCFSSRFAVTGAAQEGRYPVIFLKVLIIILLHFILTIYLQSCQWTFNSLISSAITGCDHYCNSSSDISGIWPAHYNLPPLRIYKYAVTHILRRMYQAVTLSGYLLTCITARWSWTSSSSSSCSSSSLSSSTWSISKSGECASKRAVEFDRGSQESRGSRSRWGRSQP